nr:hypothetical protein [Tanacetum cinerariifolium]
MISLFQNYNMHSMGKTIAELHAIIKLAYALKAKIPSPLERDNLTNDTIFHHCKENYNMHSMGKTIAELHAILKLAYALKAKIPSPLERDNLTNDTIFHHCMEGLRESKKLNYRALSLYVGNGMHAAVEAIGSFALVLPSGLIIVLDKFHFAPNITRGVLSIRFW